MTPHPVTPDACAVVATAVSRLPEDMVFVGGAVLPLLLPKAAGASLRITYDIDVVVDVARRSDFYALEDRLRAMGWRNVTDVICRWRTPSGILVDVMPPDSRILGFANRWYPAVLETARKHTLPAGQSIRLITPTLFVATKLDAFRSRGRSDVYASHDLEDAVAVIDGRLDFEAEFADAPPDVQTFVRTEMRQLVESSDFENALPGLVETGAEAEERADLLLARLLALVSG